MPVAAFSQNYVQNNGLHSLFFFPLEQREKELMNHLSIRQNWTHKFYFLNSVVIIITFIFTAQSLTSSYCSSSHYPSSKRMPAPTLLPRFPTPWVLKSFQCYVHLLPLRTDQEVLCCIWVSGLGPARVCCLVSVFLNSYLSAV